MDPLYDDGADATTAADIAGADALIASTAIPPDIAAALQGVDLEDAAAEVRVSACSHLIPSLCLGAPLTRAPPRPPADFFARVLAQARLRPPNRWPAHDAAHIDAECTARVREHT